MRNKKTITASVMLGVLLIGIVTAGLMGYLSNIITGTIEVSGPVFYLDGDESLLLNDNDTTETNFQIQPGVNTTFFSDRLGIDEIYKSQFDIHLWLDDDKKGSTLKVIIIKEDGEIICQKSIFIKNANHDHEELICNSKDIIDLTNKDKIGIVLSGAEENLGNIDVAAGHKYNSNGNFNRIEISKNEI